MKKSTVFGVCAGFALGAAAAIAGAITFDKIAKEIKGDTDELTFASPEGDNAVTLTFGASQTAKGLTMFKITAVSESKTDTCRLIVFAKKKEEFLQGEWLDNEHFKLRIGSGKRKQCCDVSFEGEEINARYYLMKVDALTLGDTTDSEAEAETEAEVEVELVEAEEVQA